MITLGAWLATYLVHSTILLVGALIISRFITNERAREVLWKTALLGGFVTSLIPTLTGFAPISRTWSVSTAATEVTQQLPPQADTRSTAARVPAEQTRTPARSQLTLPANPSHASFTIRDGWPFILIVAWTLGALALLARIVSRHRRILRALSGRKQLADGPLPGMLAELRRKAAVWTPVRLSESEACPTPIALGRSEICVPARFEKDLEIDQQRNALAHELAHLKRHDPLWQMTAGVIESIFFFQPLNIVARRKLRDAAEYLADDWAVQQTSSPLALARCLTQISSWVGTAPVPDGMLAMAEGGSPLINRIERLAEWRRSSSVPARVMAVAALAFVALVATSAPIFSAVPTTPNELLAVITATRSAEPQRPDTAIKYVGPAGSLDERFNWAVLHNLSGAQWVGWDTEGAPVGGTMSSSSTGNLYFGDDQHRTLANLVGAPVSSSRAGILVRFRGESEVNGVAFLPTSKAFSLGGSSVLWLGSADTKQSMALVERLRRSSRNPDMRTELAAAYVIHRDPDAVIPGVRKLLDVEGSKDARSEAIQWLARVHGQDPRAIDLLKDAAAGGRSSDERVEAVDGLRFAMESGSKRARAALLDLADHGGDMRVRSEAMQALTRHTTTR
jgi:beta-lactamase regulating signal transducer with metallopeptidase domain